MKSSLTESIKLLAKERRIIVALIVLLVVCLVSTIYAALNVQYNEVGVPIHYTAFGTRNYYYERWYYLLSFVAFGIIVAFVHAFISLKLLVSKGGQFALVFVWLSVIIMIFAFATTYQILDVVKYV